MFEKELAHIHTFSELAIPNPLSAYEVALYLNPHLQVHALQF